MTALTTAQQLAQFRVDLTAANLPADEIAYCMQRAIDALVNGDLIVSEPKPEQHPIWPTVPIVLKHYGPSEYVWHLRRGGSSFAEDIADQIAAHFEVKS